MCVCVCAYVGREIERESNPKFCAKCGFGTDLRHRVCGIIHTDLKPENVLPETNFPWCCHIFGDFFSGIEWCFNADFMVIIEWKVMLISWLFNGDSMEFHGI